MHSVTVLDTPCREWQGATKWTKAQQAKRGSRGYGNIYRQGHYWSLHRWIWTLANGPIPRGMQIMHLCDNPPCFRLDHLKVATRAENDADMRAKGRASGGSHQADKTHCPQGHPYDEANTYLRPDGKGRWCKACQLASNRRRRERHKAEHPVSPQTHCKRGHPFDEANTHINKRGARVCRTCQREAAAARKATLPPKTHCKLGHPYDEANSIISRNGDVVCRTCRVDAARRQGRRNKEDG